MATTAAGLRGRSLVSMRNHTPEEVALLLDMAAQVRDEKRRGERPLRLAGRTIAIIFLKPSSRTRAAFVVACADEGAHPEVLRAEDLRFGVKESVGDIARVLGRLYDGIAFRGFGDDVLEALVAHAGVPVWNALTEGYHPTQALADMLTIRDEFGRLDGLAMTYVGDGRNNVVRSLGIAAAKAGFELRVLAPPELQLPPDEVERLGGRIVVTDDARTALEGSVAVYNDVWVSMGEEAELERRIELLRDFKVTEELMALTGRDDTIYLHCLPAYHDLETEFARANPDVREVDDAVFEGPQSRVFDQAENRMHTAKALMLLSLAG
jgi:ornithine carbamoyltransferase